VKYQLILATIFFAGSLAAQNVKVSTQSLNATFTNLDKEPAPYIPDAQDVRAAAVRDTNQRHAEETQTSIALAHEAAAEANYLNAAAAVLSAPPVPVYYPVYYPVYIERRAAAPVATITGRPFGHGRWR
jgi:hypothetical protein